MTLAELEILFRELKTIFSVVRLVDVSMMTQYTINQKNEIVSEPYKCYAVWNRNERCENCISAKAFQKKCMMTKFEFIDSGVYFVIAKYIELENSPYVLEMVTEITDQTLFGAYGRNSFINTINSYNQRLYIDAVTGAYNRQYYNEQLKGLPKINAIAMLDVDSFKQINDTFGHSTGDLVLKKIVSMIRSLICGQGAVVRFGGDEFILTFQGVSEQIFGETLEAIRKSVSEIRIKEHPELRTSLSIGAVYCSEKATDWLEEADKALYIAKKEKNKMKVKII